MQSSTKNLTLFPLQPSSVLIAFLLDWLLFATNVLTHIRLMPMTMVMGAVLAGSATAFVEWWVAGARGSVAATKAFAVGVLVAAPLPLLGTALAAMALTWAVATQRWRPIRS